MILVEFLLVLLIIVCCFICIVFILMIGLMIGVLLFIIYNFHKFVLIHFHKLGGVEKCLWCGNSTFDQLDNYFLFKSCRNKYGCKMECSRCGNNNKSELNQQYRSCLQGFGCQKPCQNCGILCSDKDKSDGICTDTKKCGERCRYNINLCKPKYVVQNEWTHLQRKIWKYYYN